jgi:hypothetical protein
MNAAAVIIILLSLLAGRHRYRTGHHTRNSERLGTAILSATLIAWLLTVIFLLGRIATQGLAPVANAVHDMCWYHGMTRHEGPSPGIAGRPAGSQSVSFTGPASLDLPLPMTTTAARGDEALVSLRFPDSPTPLPAPLYVRTRTFDQFDGNTWHHTHPMFDASGSADTDGWVRIGNRRWDIEVEVGVPPQTGDGFPTLCDPQMLRADNLIVSDGCVFLQGIRRGGLRMRQRVHHASPDRGSWEGALPGAADGEYRAMPTGALGETLQKWVGAAQTLPEEERLAALLDRFRTYFRYAEEVRIPDGKLPLVELLENRPEGNCLLLASVFTLAARQCGFPARLCVGYAGGQRDASGTIITFTGRDAHAWCEIRIVGEGWRLLDPTAFIDPTVLSRAPGPTIAPLDFNTLGNASQANHNIVKTQTAQRGSDPYWLVIILTLGIPLALLLVFQRKRRPPGNEYPAPARRRRASRIFELIEAISRTREIPWPRSRPLREQVRRLRKADFTAKELDDAVDYVYDAIYGDSPADPRKEQQLCRRLERLLDTARTTAKGRARPRRAP